VTAEDSKYSIERFRRSGRAATSSRRSTSFAPFLNHLAASTLVAILPREVEEKFNNGPEAMIGRGPRSC